MLVNNEKIIMCQRATWEKKQLNNNLAAAKGIIAPRTFFVSASVPAVPGVLYRLAWKLERAADPDRIGLKHV